MKSGDMIESLSAITALQSGMISKHVRQNAVRFVTNEWLLVFGVRHPRKIVRSTAPLNRFYRGLTWKLRMWNMFHHPAVGWGA